MATIENTHKNLSRLAHSIVADKKVPIFQPPHAGEDPGQRAGFFYFYGVVAEEIGNVGGDLW